ncbi:MAG: hypothetical protein C5B56_15195 [Proteobacteria bacterium]|nr:MAG: hypothetical protein C5B56_15195 [Pseudomonadota bacterium]
MPVHARARPTLGFQLNTKRPATDSSSAPVGGKITVVISFFAKKNTFSPPFLAVPPRTTRIEMTAN